MQKKSDGCLLKQTFEDLILKKWNIVLCFRSMDLQNKPLL